MNEVFAEHYEVTGNKNYLYSTKRFNQEAIIGPLMNEVNELQGKRANTQILKVLGAAKL